MLRLVLESVDTGLVLFTHMESIRSFQVYGWPCFVGNGMYLLSPIGLSKGFEVFSYIIKTILVMCNFFMVKPMMHATSVLLEFAMKVSTTLSTEE